jgi:hypothetical protein
MGRPRIHDTDRERWAAYRQRRRDPQELARLLVKADPKHARRIYEALGAELRSPAKPVRAATSKPAKPKQPAQARPAMSSMLKFEADETAARAKLPDRIKWVEHWIEQGCRFAVVMKDQMATPHRAWVQACRSKIDIEHYTLHDGTKVVTLESVRQSLLKWRAKHTP